MTPPLWPGAPQQRHSQQLPTIDSTLLAQGTGASLPGARIPPLSLVQTLADNGIEEAYMAISLLSQDVLNLQAQVQTAMQ